MAHLPHGRYSPSAPLAKRLQDAFRKAHWRVEHPDGVDGIFSRGALRYVAELKVAAASRRSDLESRLAAAVLRARHYSRVLGGRPLAVVGAPAVSDAMLEHLRSFAELFARGTAWGAVDARGLVRLHGEGLREIRGEPDRSPSSTPNRFDPFSDLGQWMLKVLLHPRLPARLQFLPDSPARGDIRSATALAERATVSVPTAARLVAHLRQEHFCTPEPPLGLIRVAELMDLWRAANLRQPIDFPARWLIAVRDSRLHLADVLREHPQTPGGRACLGLFAACDRLGFRVVRGVAPHLFLEDPSAQALERIGLTRADPGKSVDVFVRRPRFPESLFRGAKAVEGVPTADVLQCWLDVVDHPARGAELGAHLHDKVIAPIARAN